MMKMSQGALCLFLAQSIGFLVLKLVKNERNFADNLMVAPRLTDMMSSAQRRQSGKMESNVGYY